MAIKRALPLLQEFAQVICENQQQVKNATDLLVNVRANLVFQGVVGEAVIANLDKAIEHLKFTS